VEQLTEGASGLELIRAIFEGRLPRPGLGILLGMDGVSVEEGRVTFALDPRTEHGNPLGTVHGGVLASMLDSAMTCAVHTLLPSGSSPTTLDLAVKFLRPVLPGSGRITAEGVAVNVGRRVGTAEGRIVDEAGRLYATGTTTCLVLREES
jgi:uncharacterized protein (TIGR00369 family)